MENKDIEIYNFIENAKGIINYNGLSSNTNTIKLEKLLFLYIIYTRNITAVVQNRLTRIEEIISRIYNSDYRCISFRNKSFVFYNNDNTISLKIKEKLSYIEVYHERYLRIPKTDYEMDASSLPSDCSPVLQERLNNLVLDFFNEYSKYFECIDNTQFYYKYRPQQQTHKIFNLPCLTKDSEPNLNFSININITDVFFEKYINPHIIVKFILHNTSEDISIDVAYNLINHFRTGYYNGKKISIESIDILERELESLIEIPVKDIPLIIQNHIYDEKKHNNEYVETKKNEINEKNIKLKLEQNKRKIENLILENQKLFSLLNERKPITHEMLFERVREENGEYFKIKNQYIMSLKKYDLSNISFDNVNIKGVDFRGTNIKSKLLDLQKIYKKDATDCNFSVEESNAENYLFDLGTDFTKVNLKGANLQNPIPCLLSPTICDAYIDDTTILPTFYNQFVKKSSAKVKKL